MVTSPMYRLLPESTPTVGFRVKSRAGCAERRIAVTELNFRGPWAGFFAFYLLLLRCRRVPATPSLAYEAGHPFMRIFLLY